MPEDPEEKAAEEKAKKERKKKKYAEREVWASDFYDNEVINIVSDYVTLGHKVLAGAPSEPRSPGSNDQIRHGSEPRPDALSGLFFIVSRGLPHLGAASE